MKDDDLETLPQSQDQITDDSAKEEDHPTSSGHNEDQSSTMGIKDQSCSEEKPDCRMTEAQAEVREGVKYILFTDMSVKGVRNPFPDGRPR